jgi:two-component system, cell cycle response regulator
MTEKRKKILIVEDEDHMLSLLKYNLGKENYDINIAHNGMEGLSEAQKTKPDLIVSDVMMPKMDGFEFCRNLRKDPETKCIPFIFLTARGQLPDKIEGLRTGADDYITKPFVPKELIEMVNARLNRVEVYKEMAETDALTGLFNQKAMKEYLSAELLRAGRMKIPVSLGFIDIDLFRNVNKRFGHPSGDKVLAAVAEAIKNMTNKEDIVGRWGGEEFLIIFPGLDEKRSEDRLNKIKEKVSQLKFEEKELSVSISAGISIFPNDSLVSDELIKKADDALFRAKQTGRDRVVIYSECVSKGV